MAGGSAPLTNVLECEYSDFRIAILALIKMHETRQFAGQCTRLFLEHKERTRVQPAPFNKCRERLLAKPFVVRRVEKRKIKLAIASRSTEPCGVAPIDASTPGKSQRFDVAADEAATFDPFFDKKMNPRRILKRLSRVRSVVGRILVDFGTASFRPRNSPPIIRTQIALSVRGSTARFRFFRFRLLPLRPLRVHLFGSKSVERLLSCLTASDRFFRLLLFHFGGFPRDARGLMKDRGIEIGAGLRNQFFAQLVAQRASTNWPQREGQ